MSDEPSVGLKGLIASSSDMLAHFDSRTAVMEIEMRQGVCNNSPAICTSPENRWRSSGLF